MTYLTSNLSLDNDTIVPLIQFNDNWAVQKKQDIATVINNSCLHRGAKIVKEKQTHTGTLVCPLHRWTYDEKGCLLGEPIPGAKGCLQTARTTTWNNMIFLGEFADIDTPPHLKKYLELKNYVHTKTEIMTVKSSWEIFMEVYLDLYHVRPYHSGLGNFVDMDNFQWHFDNRWSIQEVMLNKKEKRNPNKHFDELEKMIAANYPDIDRGALWMTIYPNVMLEWYPNMLTVSTIWPGKSLHESLNIIEYHHLEEVVAFDRDFVETQINAYATTADEDAEICELIQAGRSKAADQYLTHPSLEKGIDKFYEYLATSDASRSFRINDLE